MSVTFKIFANHNLTIGDNYQNVITLVEEKLNSKILESKEARELKIDNNKLPQGAFFHTVHKFYEKKFSEGWPLYIETNASVCERLKIYKHFVEFDLYSLMINPKTHIWRKIIARDSTYWALELWKEEDFNKVLNEWTEAKKFISMIAKRFGGDTFLYFNDGEMTIGWDLISDGITLTDLLKVLPKERKMYTYRDLEENKFEFTDADWFYEKI
jgi:hypothetical protein